MSNAMLIAETAKSADPSSWSAESGQPLQPGGLGHAVPPSVEPAGRRDAAVPGSKSEAGFWSDVLVLSKPRIVTMILVTTVATAMIGTALRPEGAGGLSVVAMLWLLIGTGGVAASAGAANQIWERVIDQRMVRTAGRPLPAGRMSAAAAIGWALFWGLGGTVLLWAMFGAAPAIVGIATWALYVLVYTPMKTRTAWNTTVGAVAGALPVFMGFTAAGGRLADPTPWLLFGVLAAWQYPHFMSIAWLYRRQYKEAGFCMTTGSDPTGRSAAIQSLVGTLAIAGCGLVLCLQGGLVWWNFAGALAVLAACWPLWKASCRFAACPADDISRTMLRSSLLTLPGVLLVTTVCILVSA
ncbi:protoheme IX farnesyltransferase [Crateriforma conspicua]|nr:protoheme IX farnesyltransferase [Crateriforma conspicua]